MAGEEGNKTAHSANRSTDKENGYEIVRVLAGYAASKQKTEDQKPRKAPHGSLPVAGDDVLGLITPW